MSLFGKKRLPKTVQQDIVEDLAENAKIFAMEVVPVVINSAVQELRRWGIRVTVELRDLEFDNRHPGKAKGKPYDSWPGPPYPPPGSKGTP